jgi:predicted HicB family RNase H-like nuclease
MKTFPIQMAPELHKRLKVMAVEAGMSLQALINQLLSETVSKKESVPAKKSKRGVALGN